MFGLASTTNKQVAWHVSFLRLLLVLLSNTLISVICMCESLCSVLHLFCASPWNLPDSTWLFITVLHPTWKHSLFLSVLELTSSSNTAQADYPLAMQGSAGDRERGGIFVGGGWIGNLKRPTAHKSSWKLCFIQLQRTSLRPAGNIPFLWHGAISH